MDRLPIEPNIEAGNSFMFSLKARLRDIAKAFNPVAKAVEDNTAAIAGNTTDLAGKVNRAGDTMTGGLTLTGATGFVAASGYVQAAGGAGPALFGNASKNYLGLQGASSSNWSFEWTKSDGSLRWLDGSSVPLLVVSGAGDATFLGNVNSGGATKSLGFSGVDAYFKPEMLKLQGTGSPEVMAQVTASPGGMYQAVQFKHNPGIAASISLNVSGAGWRFTSDGSSYNHLNSASWNVTSDMRVRQDVGAYPYGLAEILKINPVMSRFVDDKPETPRRPGFDAQQALHAMPLMRGPRSMEGPRAAELGGLLTLQPDYAWFALINAVKTLHERTSRIEAALAAKPSS